MAMIRSLEVVEQLTLAIIHVSYGILWAYSITSAHSVNLKTSPYRP